MQDQIFVVQRTVTVRTVTAVFIAYILSMPGVPCVFWPHWYTYKSDIRKMITARKKAGVHSESAVQEQSGSGWYKATVTGKYGTLILYLGSAANEDAPSGYTQAIKQNKVAIYYTGEGNPNEGVEDVRQEPMRAVKVLRDGQVVIIRGQKMYDITGRSYNLKHQSLILNLNRTFVI